MRFAASLINQVQNKFSISANHKKLILSFLIILSFFAFTFWIYENLPVHEHYKDIGISAIGTDWKDRVRISIHHLLSGENPYYPGGVQNPPWTLIPLIPISFLSEAWGSAVLMSLAFFAYGFAAYKLGHKWYSIVLLILLRPLWSSATNGNVDFLVALGFILPPRVGLFLVTVKPQLALGVILYWLVQAWRIGKIKEVLRVFAPITLAFLISLIIFGPWPTTVFQERLAYFTDPNNASLWPFGACVGVVLLLHAIKRENFRLAIIAGPFLTPYITEQGYAISFLGLSGIQTVAAFLAYWLSLFFTNR